MLKKIIHVFFVITGGTLGFLYMPKVIRFFDLTDINWILSPYFGSVLGAIIFFFLSYVLADYVVNFLKWIEDGLIKLPVVDLFFGSIGLILGLFVACLIIITLQFFSLCFIYEIF